MVINQMMAESEVTEALKIIAKKKNNNRQELKSWKALNSNANFRWDYVIQLDASEWSIVWLFTFGTQTAFEIRVKRLFSVHREFTRLDFWWT